MSGPPIRSNYLGPEGTPYEGGQLLNNLLLFGRVCKALGMEVTPDRMIEVAKALEYIELGHKRDVYHAMRALIVTRQRDLALFDEAFELYWQTPAEGWTTLDLRSLGEQRHKRKTQFVPPAGAEPDDESEDDSAKPAIDPSLIVVVPTHSQQEVLRYKDFADMTAEELAAVRQIIARLPKSLGFRRSRRFRPGKGGQIDPRRVFRRNLRYNGEPLILPTRRRKVKPRPLVLLSDISGSMERYTRVLLHFMHTLAQGMYQVESFVFGTRLTRITHPIRYKSVDVALREVGTSVKDWGGGTKTGDSLHTFNFKWSRRVLGRGAIVMLITDGWDRGDPDLLRKETERLQLNSYRLIWLNPLLGVPEYEPLTRGAQSMLPYVDDFLPVRNLANLEMIFKVLQALNQQRSHAPSHAQHTARSV